ncbi:MAG TPA: hypothetical protein PLY61_09205 [Anaerohalosphaeraceae bacterium]|jgi:hypothetical protein|nr:hypothetical protein [Anaerohalosphaeraceae bacterium]
MSTLPTILFTVLLACVASGFSAQGTAPGASSSRLTIEESLIPMFARGNYAEIYYSDEGFPFDRINPGIREYLLFCLRKDDADPYHAYGALWLLGFVGEADDLTFVEEYISGKLHAYRSNAHELRNLAGISGCFAGMMTARQVAGSAAFIQKYASPSSWTLVDGSVDSEGPSGQLAREAYSNFIMAAFTYSKAEYLRPLLEEKAVGSKPLAHELFADSLKRLDVGTYARLVTRRSIPEEEMQRNINKCLVSYGHWIDLLVRKETYSEWRRAQAEKAKAARQKTARTVSLGVRRKCCTQRVDSGNMHHGKQRGHESFRAGSRQIICRRRRDLAREKEDAAASPSTRPAGIQ